MIEGIDLDDKSHNAPVPNPKIHHNETKKCTNLCFEAFCRIPDRCIVGFVTFVTHGQYYPIRRAANPEKVLYLRSLMPPPPPTRLICNNHLIANFLSFHMSLVVVMNCGAGNALRGFEISMFYFFLKLYFIHISKDILPLRALNAIKQCK